MSINRRNMLAGLAASAAGLVTLPAPARAGREAKRSLRVAYLTDSHLPTPPGQNERMKRALDQVLGQKDKADLFVFGGDNVMAVDGSRTAEEAAKAQFTNWSEQVLSRLKTPSLSVIGNHDIFWNDASAATPRDPKARAIETYGMSGRYYAKVVGDWKFIGLDTFHKDGCKIDDEQFQWLKTELADKSRPVLVISHAPILTVTSYFESKVEDKGKYNIPSGWMVAETAKLKELFLASPHVRLGLSGHMHQIDRVEYQGMTYVCGGAVSGNWWNKTKYIGFGPAYLMVDLFSDGSFRHETVFWE